MHNICIPGHNKINKSYHQNRYVLTPSTEHRAQLTASATNTFSLYNSQDDQGSLRFHHLHGRNSEVSNNGLTALRPNATGEFNDAIIMSNRPMKDGELFEIVIDKMVDRWSGSIEAG